MLGKKEVSDFETKQSINQNLTFNATQDYFNKQNLDLTSEMESLGLIEPKTKIFTNLALLLSDQNPYSVNVSTFSDQNMSEIITNREFNGSILKQIEKVLQFVDLINKRPLKYEKQYKIVKSDYPDMAVREAVINSILHRDYSLEEPISIKINQTRFDIASPGSLLKNLKVKDLRNGIHLSRHPNLSKLLQYLNLIRAKGYGIVQIFSSYEKEDFEPEIITSSNLFQLILPNRNNFKKEVEVSELIKEVNLNNNSKFTPSQKKLLISLQKIRVGNKKELQEESGLKNSNFYKALNFLMDLGLVSKKYYGENVYFLTDSGITAARNQN